MSILLQTTVAARHKLCADHPAAAGANGQRRPSQAEQILKLLRQARERGEPLALPVILNLRIAQHGARLHELRLKGHIIRNEMSRTPEGTVRSECRLVFDPERDGAAVDK